MYLVCICNKSCMLYSTCICNIVCVCCILYVIYVIRIIYINPFVDINLHSAFVTHTFIHKAVEDWTPCSAGKTNLQIRLDHHHGQTHLSRLFSVTCLLGVKMQSSSLERQARKCVGVSFHTKHLVWLSGIQKKKKKTNHVGVFTYLQRAKSWLCVSQAPLEQICKPFTTRGTQDVVPHGPEDELPGTQITSLSRRVVVPS